MNSKSNHKQTTPKTNNTMLNSDSTNMSTMQGSPSNNQMGGQFIGALNQNL
jgi:hypothetical protein